MKTIIETTNSVYTAIRDSRDSVRLSGGRIKKPEGVVGYFLNDVKVGSRPVFFNVEPLILIYDDEEHEVPEQSSIRLSTIKTIRNEEE